MIYNLFIMHNANILPLTPLLGRHPVTKLLTNRSLSASLLSIETEHPKQNGIKLKNSHYNDRKNIYMKKSRTLSQRSLCYQSKTISMSARKKYSENKLQALVEKSKTQSQPRAQSQNPVFETVNHTEPVRQRYRSIQKSYANLLNKQHHTKMNKKLLQKERKQIGRQNTEGKKWVCPFTNANTYKKKYEGKELVGKKREGIQINTSKSELKVLNLDRMFRKKDGVLGSVIGIPTIQMGEVSSRKNMGKILKKKDPIHDVMGEYNRLLRITKLNKTQAKLGVRGHNFTKKPTLEQIMGIKIHSKEKQRIYAGKGDEAISDEVFEEYNEYYNQHIKKTPQLKGRFIAGLKQKDVLNLPTISRYYNIFINRVAKADEKINFLAYFFIPKQVERIELDHLKYILEVMCQQLPPLENFSWSTPLSSQDKSHVFYEALNRVLFADIHQFRSGTNLIINRNILQMILQENEDAVDLLIKLLIKG